MTTENRTIKLKVKRQECPQAKPRWEEFQMPYRPYMNIVICLREIQKDPRTSDGKQTTPVVWECGCLEEVCGVAAAKGNPCFVLDREQGARIASCGCMDPEGEARAGVDPGKRRCASIQNVTRPVLSVA